MRLNRIPVFTTKTYWGQVEEAHALTRLALKRMTMKAGTQSSLELHVKKMEIYWLQSGRLKIGFRKDRAINDEIILEAGEAIEIPPGTPHMRMALTDCVILEAASFDDATDTVFIEDGRTYSHEIQERSTK